MILPAAILLIAFILDLLLGDPPFSFHPVRLMGLCASHLEKLLLGVGLAGLLGGTFLAVWVVCLSIGVYLTIRFVLNSLHPWLAIVLDIYLTYSCLALADLIKHASPVAEFLDRDNLAQGRAALQKIVGRDTGSLNPAGVARGAVESVAENFVDGVVSPLLWYTFGALLCQMLKCPAPTVAGVLAILSFKAISTLDSMVGYRHNHYLLFGRTAARLDDLANFVPARLSIILLYIGALLGGESAGAGWKIARRDRLKHSSPNAGQPESFVAGALGIRLGGPTVYKQTTVDKPWLGDGNEEIGPGHIRRCCRLVYRSSWVAVIVFAAILVSFSGVFS